MGRQREADRRLSVVTSVGADDQRVLHRRERSGAVTALVRRAATPSRTEATRTLWSTETGRPPNGLALTRAAPAAPSPTGSGAPDDFERRLQRRLRLPGSTGGLASAHVTYVGEPASGGTPHPQSPIRGVRLAATHQSQLCRSHRQRPDLRPGSDQRHQAARQTSHRPGRRDHRRVGHPGLHDRESSPGRGTSRRRRRGPPDRNMYLDRRPLRQPAGPCPDPRPRPEVDPGQDRDRETHRPALTSSLDSRPSWIRRQARPTHSTSQ